MEKVIQQYCAQNEVDGLSLSIMKEGEIVFEYHHQSSEKMRYTIGSVSKTFIAISILQLVEKGKCQLTDSVSEYIPDIDDRITIEMLLNHSCGVDCVNFKGKYTDHYYPQYVDHMIERYQEGHLKSRPGKYSVYTNDGFVIAQRLIEFLSGLSFHDYLIQEICDQAGMKDTTCPPERMEEGTFKACKNGFGKEYPQEFVNGIGSGGIYSTSHDLNRLLYALNHQQLLTQDSFNNMISDHFINHIPVEMNAARYGLGVDHVEIPYFKAMGLKAYTKGGATYGYYSNIIHIPSLDLSLSVVSASLKGNIGLLAREVLGMYLGLEVNKVTLPPYQRCIDLGIYGNGNHVYNLYMEDQLVVEVYQDGQFVRDCTMELVHGRFKAKKAFGFDDVEMAMVQHNGYSYIVLDYFQQVHQRCIFAQKLEEQDCWIQLQSGYYVRNNEYIDQRNMNTQGQLCFYLDQNLYSPYPLKAISPTLAIPYVELPGSYAREMTQLEVIDPTTFKLGNYIYELLTDRKLSSYTIQSEKVQWFEYHQEKITVSDQVRIIGLDEKGKYIYDSHLSLGDIQGKYVGILGAVNEKVQVDQD